jgi:hypothetical protein
VRPLVLAHVAWSALVLLAAAAVIGLERSLACPPGGWLALDCGAGRDLVLALIGLSAVVYVVILSAVLAWAIRGARRPGADASSARDWYLVAALVGMVIAPLLAFTVLAGLGWLG